jgi:hypothetical protein
LTQIKKPVDNDTALLNNLSFTSLPVTLYGTVAP